AIPQGRRHEQITPELIQKRRFENGRAKQIGTLRQHYSRQQPAVVISEQADAFGGSNAASDHIFGDSNHVVIGALTCDTSNVPVAAALAAAAYIRDHISATPLEPELT